MYTRKNTKKIKVGNIFIGGSDKVLIQSMCNIKTSRVSAIVKQINKCQNLGADLMRVSIMDKRDANAIKSIKKQINMPLIGDIHFDYKLAILAIKNGIDAIRINPGNISSEEHVKEILFLAKEKNIPIRIGVNSGSIDKTINDYQRPINENDMIKSINKQIKIFNKYGFDNIVLSLKGSNIKTTIAAYISAAKKYNYPLHIGITEASINEISLIRSSAGLSPLLLLGLGDTIRISISGNPYQEIVAAKRLLHDLGLYPNYPTIISCPTCGRTMVDVTNLAKKVLNYLENNNINLTVAIMGCIVNGPGEGKSADIGIAGGKGNFVLFKKGKIVRKIEEKNVYQELINEINEMIK